MNRLHAFRLQSLLALIILALAAPLSAAQWHHLHLLVPDTKAAADWYAKNMGGQYERVIDTFDAAVFGKYKVLFKKAEGEVLPTEGTTVDHIGFSFADLDAKMKEFEAAGIKILQPARPLGKIKFGFILDPWGTKIEVMQDPDLLGFHHIHMHTPDPDAMLKWYAGITGGTPTKYAGMLPALNVDGVWLLAQKFPVAKKGTEGSVIDHLAFSEPDLDAAAVELKAKGVKFTEEPHPFGKGKKSFVEGPGGVKVEILQAPHHD